MFPSLKTASLLGAMLITGALLAAAPPAAEGAKKYALLVGCTKYQNLESLTELWGPANDVPLVAKLLTEQFGFPRDQVRQLVGWPDDPAARPTAANITAGFENLLARAGPDTQIVILLAGHGTQVPNPDAARSGRPNRLAFLPADVKPWAGDGLPNALTDDRIKGWLDQLRAKGALVWAVFDCCHSGSMTRGTPQDVERVRSARPQDLGIPDAALEAAARQARTAPQPPGGERTRGGTGLVGGTLGVQADPKGRGSLVAFYACQPFELAPEMPRPEDAPRTPGHYYGLLSFTLSTALQQRQSPLTYRELGQLLVARYQADRGSRGPSPICEGDLDREVLGLNRWPGRSAVVLERTGGKLRVTAGALMGLTAGSVLSVHPPAGDPRDVATVLGHLRVVKASPLLAEVEPSDAEGKPAPGAAPLPDLARCQILRQDFGDLRLKVAVAPGPEPGAAVARAALGALTADKDFKDLVQGVPVEAAEWVLRPQAEAVELWQGEGRAGGTPAEAPRGQVCPARRFARYPARDAAQVQKNLERDLQKIFTWQNVWRIAGGLDRGAGEAAPGVKLEVLRLQGPEGREQPDGPLPSGAAVAPGQRVLIRLTNEGTKDLWVSLLFLDANFGIDLIKTTVAAGKIYEKKGVIDEAGFGREGIVVLAVPLAVARAEPLFDFLTQEPLKSDDPQHLEDRTRGVDRAKAEERTRGDEVTPFGQLMKTARLGQGTRGFKADAPTNPAVLSWSWTQVPAGK